MEWIYILNIILFYYMYNVHLSFGGGVSMVSTQTNSTISSGNPETTEDELAGDVDWISAVSGMVIIFVLAACYAIYVLNRRRKDLKQQAQDQQFSLMMATREVDHNAGVQTQLDDFR
mmetsp:Transcript_54891/g.49397  ORF Transcript_54891/g.49397 Transcript_54891/m.49397 type:complete len:117 (+) Transcript_54891:466-816(+)